MNFSQLVLALLNTHANAVNLNAYQVSDAITDARAIKDAYRTMRAERRAARAAEIAAERQAQSVTVGRGVSGVGLSGTTLGVEAMASGTRIVGRASTTGRTTLADGRTRQVDTNPYQPVIDDDPGF